MPQLRETTDVGQSIWLDYINRAFIESGDLQKLIDDGLRGLTSNPSIFEAAIGAGSQYDDDLRRLVQVGESTMDIYEALAVKDIQQAADLFRPIYDESNGTDGFVSLEVNPDLAYETEETIAEARHLFKTVDRPNVMIKVPATAAGIPAIATLIGEGINVNATLMFSLGDYEAVSDAYLRGLERLAAKGGDVSKVASVASFFVSRVDTAVNKKLAALDDERAGALMGKIGIANAKMAYARYLNVFSSERWQRLAAQGAHVQRILFGSTSTKNPDYPDTMYVDGLMGANTVNTLPLKTIKALQDHGRIASGLTENMDEARAQLIALATLGIDLEIVTQQLQEDGVNKFADSFDEMLDTISAKCDELTEPEPA